MEHKVLSIRPFIGAKDFDISRQFYCDLGFEETKLGHTMSVFQMGNLAFYLQRAYVKEWVNNTMIFMEVDNADSYYSALLALDLPKKYEGVRLIPTQILDWGKECFLHDPSGILWHFGEFNKDN
jgi:catechol 2,3-dioxygenase-like lactoylglutathione lyase family enzyme